MQYRDIFGRYARKSGNWLVTFARYVRRWIAFLLAYPFRWAWREFKALEWRRKGLLLAMVLCAVLPLGSTVAGKIQPKTLVYTASRAEAMEIKKDITLEEAKMELDAIVWGGESGKQVPVEGEILPTFDPSKKMYAMCVKIGGRMNKDCLSYGPRQEKIGTIQYYWPQLHDGKQISEKEARAVAEGLQSSYEFFMGCSIRVKGCVGNWMTAHVDIRDPESPIRPDVQVLINIIRKGEGIAVKD